MDKLSNWVFTYDNINKQWRAAKREDHRELFNDHKSNKVIRSSNLDTIQGLIMGGASAEELNNIFENTLNLIMGKTKREGVEL